jgi:L-lysine exporter family protein LysE/ArgO
MLTSMLTLIPAALAGFTLSFSLIVAIGPQNAHVLRMGLARRHVFITVAACAVTDAILITIGVLGLASITALSPYLYKAMLVTAIAFLLWYGFLAARRAIVATGALTTQSVALPSSAKNALLTALAFSWLNPHAWLDTAVLVGSASLSYSHPSNLAFGAGAILGSFVWFVALAWVATKLAKRLAKPSVWRAIDAVVAVTMAVTAAYLIKTAYA